MLLEKYWIKIRSLIRAFIWYIELDYLCPWPTFIKIDDESGNLEVVVWQCSSAQKSKDIKGSLVKCFGSIRLTQILKSKYHNKMYASDTQMENLLFMHREFLMAATKQR